jgi:maleylacetate reductase
MLPPETQRTRHTMQSGTMVFTQMNRVIFGQPAAATIVAEADRLGAKRVFLLTGRTLNRSTDEVEKVRRALGSRMAGVHDHMPAHSPRDAVVACANAARAAGTDLLVTFGGGSVTDGGKAVTICLEHGVADVDGMEPFRTILATASDGSRTSVHPKSARSLCQRHFLPESSTRAPALPTRGSNSSKASFTAPSCRKASFSIPP